MDTGAGFEDDDESSYNMLWDDIEDNNTKEVEEDDITNRLLSSDL